MLPSSTRMSMNFGPRGTIGAAVLKLVADLDDDVGAFRVRERVEAAAGELCDSGRVRLREIGVELAHLRHRHAEELAAAPSSPASAANRITATESPFRQTINDFCNKICHNRTCAQPQGFSVSSLGNFVFALPHALS